MEAIKQDNTKVPFTNDLSEEATDHLYRLLTLHGDEYIHQYGLDEYVAQIIINENRFMPCEREACNWEVRIWSIEVDSLFRSLYRQHSYNYFNTQIACFAKTIHEELNTLSTEEKKSFLKDGLVQRQILSFNSQETIEKSTQLKWIDEFNEWQTILTIKANFLKTEKYLSR